MGYSCLLLQAVELCAELCIETDNYEVSMWRPLLQHMIQLNMVCLWFTQSFCQLD